MNNLTTIAREVRKDIIDMTARAGSGHYMSSLSAVEILVALYFRILTINPANPAWEDRDRFILSKGHAAPALYSVLSRAGYFNRHELRTLRKMKSRLQGHPVAHRLPGIDASSGSLGQGLSIGIGMALAAKMDDRHTNVYVLAGDGELQEGQIWEAVMAAVHFHLDNLVLIVDQNGLQATGSVWYNKTEPYMALSIFRSFGWLAHSVNGHNIWDIIVCLKSIYHRNGKPAVVFARTIKGKGIDFIEGNLKYHAAPLTKEELKKARACLEREE